HNDLAMLSVADTAVAMANATDDVKAAAHIVIGPNTESSVARFIADDTM
ncbi:MAG: HAD family hydrolase, partial [Candidatus Amulumruptor sp.]|nr:HAD family hydrolase [Candidatus Amulumruptor sp.]